MAIRSHSDLGYRGCAGEDAKPGERAVGFTVGHECRIERRGRVERNVPRKPVTRGRRGGYLIEKPWNL